MKRVRADALENLIVERLIEMGRDSAFLKRILEEAEQSSESELSLIEERRDFHKQALAPIEQEVKNIVRFVAQGRVSEALSQELEKLEAQKREIVGELERINLEAREIASRSINAKIVQEGLGLFGDIWEHAEPEERKELMRLFIHKVIFTPTEIRLGLHTRPISAKSVESASISNYSGVGAVDRTSWLPMRYSLPKLLSVF